MIESLKDQDLEKTASPTPTPLILNYLLCPHMPTDPGSLLSPTGKVIMANYATMPWKRLAEQLQACIDALDVPKGITVYVGNDAIDLLDMAGFNVGKDAKDDCYNAYKTALKTFEGAQLSDYQDGICSAPKRLEDFHLNPYKHNRPPAAGLFVSIRFASDSLISDYLGVVTHAVIGVVDHLETEGEVFPPCPMPEVLLAWLRKEMGPMYFDDGTCIRLSATRDRA